ncbi:conserved exported hypothetical protein [Bradyrhizobium sp. STM 3809]|nr:conserved exported hypothetical protein [Bradyrhizobium sp. STM 3809]
MFSCKGPIGLALCWLIVACPAPAVRALEISRSAQETPPLAAIAPPPTPVPLENALSNAAHDLLSKFEDDAAPGQLELVIDPLIDGVTRVQSTATLLEQQRITAMIAANYHRIRTLPFTVASLLRKPLVLIGTLTPINNDGLPTGPRDAYRICLAIADLNSNTVVSKGVARALPDDVDPTPVPFFRDSPVYTKDPATEAYVKSCQGAKPGDAVDQTYTNHILASAQVNEGIEAYNAGRYKAALELYQTALRMDGGEQLRIYSGIYLSALKLGHTQLAMQAFDRLLDFGLKNSDRLAIKFLFKPGSTLFYADPEARAPYQAWIGKIAQRTAANHVCLEVAGHTSATGYPGVNDRLSVLRAAYVKDQILAEDRSLAGRLIASGRGSREMIVGTGRDDPSDALDRRVELRIINCSS